MKRTTFASTLVVGAVSAVSLFGAAAPAVSGPKPPPPPPAAAGCYNITNGGGPVYQRLLASITQNERVAATPLTPALYDKAVIEERDRGVVFGNVALEAPSCTDATYVLEVYAPAANPDGTYRLLAKTTEAGDGTRQLLNLDTVLRLYSGQTVRLQAFVYDAYNRLIDQGVSDAKFRTDEATVTALDDGLAPPGSGGSSFWG